MNLISSEQSRLHQRGILFRSHGDNWLPYTMSLTISSRHVDLIMPYVHTRFSLPYAGKMIWLSPDMIMAWHGTNKMAVILQIFSYAIP